MTLYQKYLNAKSKQYGLAIHELIDEVLNTDLKDTQWFLNWLDSLNEESVRY